jgi:hypothetical protein
MTKGVTMRTVRRAAGGAIVVAVVFAAIAAANASSARFANCSALNKRYPHGVGRYGAHDHTASGRDPVTNFKRSNVLYAANRGLDRDKDGIACEKH